MKRSLIVCALVLPALLISSLTGCSEAQAKALEGLKSKVEGVDFGALLKKAEGASADVKTQATAKINELKTEKQTILSKITGLMKDKAPDLGGIKDMVTGFMSKVGDLKKMLGM